MLAYQDPGRAYRETLKRIKQALEASRALGGLERLQQTLLRQLGDDQREILRRAEFTLPCQAGCSYCCHLRVEAFAHEILLLHQAITALADAPQREAIAARLAANAAQISAIGEEQHWVTNIPCALLVDDRCSLHHIRPLTCARYHSTDLAACQRGHEDPLQYGDRRPVIPEVDLQGDVPIQAMTDALKRAGLDHRRYELNTSLARLLEGPALAQRWRQGKPLLPTTRQRPAG